MYSAILLGITLILFGLNYGGFAAIDVTLIAVLLIITGIVVIVEGTGVYKRFDRA